MRAKNQTATNCSDTKNIQYRRQPPYHSKTQKLLHVMMQQRESYLHKVSIHKIEYTLYCAEEAMQVNKANLYSTEKLLQYRNTEQTKSALSPAFGGTGSKQERERTVYRTELQRRRKIFKLL